MSVVALPSVIALVAAVALGAVFGWQSPADGVARADRVRTHALLSLGSACVVLEARANGTAPLGGSGWVGLLLYVGGLGLGAVGAVTGLGGRTWADRAVGAFRVGAAAAVGALCADGAWLPSVAVALWSLAIDAAAAVDA